MQKNSPGRVLFASLIGTTIEFFDFYIYATAAVLVFPHLFFPATDPASATLQSLATFALAFFARPVGSAVFGHYGDRIGRKATLVAALLTMGLSTVIIGLLPTYHTAGLLAPALLALCRFGQGFGLGGEWGGAVLLATENAPPGKQNWYGMFPQLGAPIGFVCSTGVFLLLTQWLDDGAFLAWGWRVPFLASAALVLLGLWVRLHIEETPAFQRALQNHERVRVPVAVLLRHHGARLVLGTFGAVATFVAFYLMTVFTLSWGTSALGYSRQSFLVLQMGAVVCFAITIPLSAWLADRFDPRSVLIGAAASLQHEEALPVARPRADGPHLRAARRRSRRALPDRRALHGRVADVQLRGHHRRVAHALRGDVARAGLRAARGRLVSVRDERPHAGRAAPALAQRDGRAPLIAANLR
jgi:MFS family permease